MKSVFLLYIGFLSIFVAKIKINAFRNCTISLHTIEFVKICPKSQEEWRNASANKNCSQFSHACDSIEYHCVMNSWRNETIEVCAPPWNIVGKVCAEYNHKGNLIQRNNKANCSECPQSYISTESFKYQECYSQIEKMSRSTESQTTTYINPGPTTQEKTMNVSDASSKKEHIGAGSQGSNANIIVILVLHVVCTVVGVLLAFIAIYKIPCKLGRITSNHPKELPVNGNDSANETFLANGSPNLEI